MPPAGSQIKFPFVLELLRDAALSLKKEQKNCDKGSRLLKHLEYFSV